MIEIRRCETVIQSYLIITTDVNVICESLSLVSHNFIKLELLWKVSIYEIDVTVIHCLREREKYSVVPR